MGGFFAKLFPRFAVTPMRVLMLGLDAAGKTTVLYKLKLGDIVTTIPTIGFNVESVSYKTAMFTVWDVGGRGKIRPLWRHYYQGVTALIYVVDSNDRERIDETRQELDHMLRESELEGLPVLVLANKQDLPNAMSVAEVADKLGLHSIRGRQWFIQSTCATSGDGLYEGLDWLSHTLAQARIPKTEPPAPTPAPAAAPAAPEPTMARVELAPRQFLESAMTGLVFNWRTDVDRLRLMHAALTESADAGEANARVHKVMKSLPQVTQRAAVHAYNFTAVQFLFETVQARLADKDAAPSWAEFAAANDDLLDLDELMAQHYTPEARLDPRAFTEFVAPDVGA